MAESWLESANQAEMLGRSAEIRARCRVSATQDNEQSENTAMKTMCGLGV